MQQVHDERLPPRLVRNNDNFMADPNSFLSSFSNDTHFLEADIHNHFERTIISIAIEPKTSDAKVFEDF